MEILVLKSADELEGYSAELDDLAQCSSVQNVLYEWWALAPALRYLHQDERLQIVLVRDPSRPLAKSLLGLFPFEQHRKYSKVPLAYLGLWRHLQLLLCDPLLRRGDESRALGMLFQWAENLRPGLALLNFGTIAEDSEFTRQLKLFVQQSGRALSRAAIHQRAFLTCQGSFEQYVNKMPRKRRKELGRLERRLSDSGRVTKYVAGPGTPATIMDRLVECFLTLEAKGWKGKEGTALGSTAKLTEYFLALTRVAHRRGRLSMVVIALNDEPVALQCNIHDRSGAFSYKITYDEAHAACSPGILVAAANLRYMLEESGLSWMDSGAVADHPMIDRLWYERRGISSYNVRLNTVKSWCIYYSILTAKKVYKFLTAIVSGNQTKQGVRDEQ